METNPHPPGRLVSRREFLEKYDGEGMPPLLTNKDLSVAELVFVMKSCQGKTPLERMEFMMEWGIMCDHPPGQRLFHGKRRWFFCKLCESTSIFIEPVKTAPVTPGPGPQQRLAAAA